MKSTIIAFLLTLTIFCSCYKNNHCGETAGVERSYLSITFLKGGNYMYSDITQYSLYNKDSLIIYDQSGNRANLLSSAGGSFPNNPSVHYYIFGITPVYNSSTDGAAFNQEISRKLYIQYNSMETDTLICTFKANKNECNTYLEYLKVYYRNNLIGSSNDGLGGNVTIKKP